MQCTGTVIEGGGESARVLIESRACDHCHACGLGAIRNEKSMVVSAVNTVGAEKDDQVHLELSGRRVMSASAVLFLVPFAGFMLGFLLGYFPVYWLVGVARVPVTLVSALVCLVASYYPVKVLGARYDETDFVIQSIVAGDEPLTPFESRRSL